MGLNASADFKTPLLLQITAKRFQTCPEFSSQLSSQTTFRFLIFLVSDLAFFSLMETFCSLMVSYGETPNLNYLENTRP